MPQEAGIYNINPKNRQGPDKQSNTQNHRLRGLNTSNTKTSLQ